MRSYPEICANCNNWRCFGVEANSPEDDCGSCRKKNGEIMMGDDDACDDYDEMENPRVNSYGYFT